MDIEVSSVIDLPDVQLTVTQRLESEDRKSRYRVETTQREQLLLQAYGEADWSAFEHEHECLTHLGQHENVLSLSRAAIIPGPPKAGLLLYDTMPIGLLSKLSSQVQDLSEQQVLNYAKEIAKGLFFMHSRGLTHGNLRLGNVWVGSDFRCKIAGFEQAIIGNAESKPQSGNRDDSIQAPECTRGGSPRPASDIWAFGCLIYSLLYRDFPFASSYFPPGQIIAEWKPQSKPVASDWDFIFSRVFMVSPNGRAGARELIDTLGALRLDQRSCALAAPLEVREARGGRRGSWMGNSTKSWVQSATLEDSAPPDSECMRKLISKAWNKPQKVPKFFSAYQRLNFTRTITAIKALLVLHGYVLQGPVALVTTHAESIRKLTEKCEVLWSLNARIKPDEHYTEYIAGLIRQFLRLLQRKLELHSLSKSMGSWQNADLATYSTVTQALGYWTDSLLLASRLFIGGRDLVDLRLAWMVQVMEDVLGLYTALCRNFPCVLSQVEDSAMKAVLILKFQSNFSKLTGLGKGLQRQRPGYKMVELPEAHPEEIQRLTASIPTGADTVSIFLTENECPQTDTWRSATVQFTTLKAVSVEVQSRARAATEGTSSAKRKSPERRTQVAAIPENSESEPESPHALDARLRGLLLESPPWLILMDELQFREVMSMGIYFTVYRGEYRRTTVAIGVLRSFVQKPQFTTMVEFISLMSRVSHPNLVLFMGASVGRQIAIVTEMCAGGSLQELLHDRTDYKLQRETAYGLLADVARALHALHSHTPPLAHGELSSAKVLLVDEVTSHSTRVAAKLSEFGIRLFLDPTAGASQLGFWTAPEVAEGGEVTPAADIFSFGVLMLEVLMRKVPTATDILEKTPAKSLPANASSLLIQCLERNAQLRPTSRMVLDVFDSLAL